MRLISLTACVISTVSFGAFASADSSEIVKPTLVLKQIVEGMPNENKKEVGVFAASFKPGDKTPTHTHNFPVTVYVLEGAFTLALKGKDPITVKAGEAMVEPANVEMTGFNPSTEDITKVVIYYVNTPGSPFLNPMH